MRVVEVDRPNRQRRRRRGKSDPQDAISAARAALSGDACGEAKTRDGNVESMRVLRVARSSARKGRTQALNQMRNLVSTAPDPIRAELRGLSVFHLLERASAYRPGAKRDIVSLTKFSLRMLARRALTLEEEISEIDAILKPLVKETAPELVATARHRDRRCLGAASWRPATIPDDCGNEAAFAHLCGASSPPRQLSSSARTSGQRSSTPARWSSGQRGPSWHMVLTRSSASIDSPEPSGDGVLRMPDDERCREAVCGRTACTV